MIDGMAQGNRRTAGGTEAHIGPRPLKSLGQQERAPDKLTGRGDVVVGDIHAERIFAKTDNVLACLTIETNKAVK